MLKYHVQRVNFSFYPAVNGAFHLMIFHENGSVLLFYCQCHDFKVGQASKSRNWLVDGCWRATRIMTKMRWKSQLGFRSQCGNFRNLHTFIFSQKFREIIAFSTRLHCMAFSWIIFLWKWNSIISTLCSLLLIKLKTKTFHLYLDSWTLGDKIGVFNEKFKLKATLGNFNSKFSVKSVFIK